MISVCLFASCGSESTAEKQKNANYVAQTLSKGAASAFEELYETPEINADASANVIVSSNPNYNYTNSAVGMQSWVYDYYKSLGFYTDIPEEYEYIIVAYSNNVYQVFVSESWNSNIVGKYNHSSAVSNYYGNLITLSDDFSTLQDAADEVMALSAGNGYNHDQFSSLYGSNIYGSDISNNKTNSFSDIEAAFADIDYYGLLDELIEFFGSAAFKVFLIIFVVSIIWCFFGYQVFQVFAAIFSLLLMLLTGVILSLSTGSAMALGVCVIIGIVLAIICAKSKSFAAFMMGFIGVFPIAFILGAIAAHGMKQGFFIGIGISVVIGIIVAILKKPLIILSSAIGYGPVAGAALSCMMTNTRLGKMLGIIFVCLGILIQSALAHGILESGSLIKKIIGKSNLAKPETAGEYPYISPETEYAPPVKPLVKTKDSAKSPKPIKPIKPAKVKNTMKKSCPNCGAKYSSDSRFCIKCGASIEKSILADTCKDSVINPSPATVLNEESVMDYRRIEEPKPESKPELHRAGTEFSDSISDESTGKLSLGGLGGKSGSSAHSGGLVINVEKSKSGMTETRKSESNAHFSSADDFDD